MSLKKENLILLESADNYVCVWYMNNDTVKKIMIRNTMKCMARDLDGSSIVRCHRSYIVNVQKVAKVERFTRNSFNLTLADAAQTQIPLAKGRADEMRDRYGWR